MKSNKAAQIAAVIFLSAALNIACFGADKIEPQVKARFWEKSAGNAAQCLLCPRYCKISEGNRGLCTVRINKGGELYTLGYSNPVAVNVDPIEKKPFFHVYPGSTAFSIAVAGCNMRCLFCQNWQISQSKPDETTNYFMPPEQVVSNAKNSGSKFIVYTYTEPTVFYEYMYDIAKLARAEGLKNGMHSCGYINPDPLRELLKYMDAVNIDLKGFNEEFYKKMGAFAQLAPVLDTLKAVKAAGVWLEITNLIIPGMNDDPEEIKRMCVWIKDNLGDEVPLHFSRFYPAYNLKNMPPTPESTLHEAYKIAKEVGLKYVYIGNMPGAPEESTYCPKCGRLLIKRNGYNITEDHIKGGQCGYCGFAVAGIWTDDR